jgi:hypothetical protein
MKTVLITAIVAATATVLLAQSKENPRNSSAPKRESREKVLPKFLEEEVIEFRAGLDRRARTFTNMEKMHDAYINDFASKPGFGASRVVHLPPQDFFTHHGQTYRFHAPNLIGLEDEPIAYQRPWGEIISVAALSKKESRAMLKRRQLTPEETRAVAELRAGKSLVTLPKQIAVRGEHGTTNIVDGVLAVGALRAKAQCAECHQVKQGTLLGAFAYTLVPTNSTPPSVLATLGR